MARWVGLRERRICWRRLIVFLVFCGAGCRSEVDVAIPSPSPLTPSRTPTHSVLYPTEINSRVATPTVPPLISTVSQTKELKCAEPKSQIQDLEYPGVVVKEEIPVIVYLPPCYTVENPLYPVLFLLHGFPFDENHWQSLGALDVTEQAMLSDRWPDTILVMPQQPAPIFTKSDGGPNSYEREFLNGVLPFIVETFQLSQEDPEWSLAGISRGGVWALEIALRAPGSFHRVAAISPSLNVNYPRHIYDPFWLVTQEHEFEGSILVAVGEEDHSVRLRVEEFRDALARAEIEHVFLLEPGSHDSDFWISVIDPVLGFLIASEK